MKYSTIYSTKVHRVLSHGLRRCSRVRDGAVRPLDESVSERTSMTFHSAYANSTELNMFLLIHNYDWIGTFATVEISSRLYLSIFVTKCTGERLFSKLKLINNYMEQESSSSLSLLSIEYEQLKDIEFNVVITNFAQRKVHKQPV